MSTVRTAAALARITSPPQLQVDCWQTLFIMSAREGEVGFHSPFTLL
jgi:hypothetical protein